MSGFRRPPSARSAPRRLAPPPSGSGGKKTGHVMCSVEPDTLFAPDLEAEKPLQNGVLGPCWD